MNNLAEILSAFRQKKLKVTPQRIAIMKNLQGNRQHPSANALYNTVKLDYPSISLTTVYKTLEVLRDMGQVNEIHISKERVFFDPNVRPHNHLICEGCSRIFDIPSIFGDRMEFLTLDPARIGMVFRPTNCQLYIYGYCGRCKRSD